MFLNWSWLSANRYQHFSGCLADQLFLMNHLTLEKEKLLNDHISIKIAFKNIHPSLKSTALANYLNLFFSRRINFFEKFSWLGRRCINTDSQSALHVVLFLIMACWPLSWPDCLMTLEFGLGLSLHAMQSWRQNSRVGEQHGFQSQLILASCFPSITSWL